VFNTARQLHFTRSLEHFSMRLDELLESACLHQSQLPPELIDEIALTTGELMLVMTNYPGHHGDELIREVLSHAKSLRERLRVGESPGDQVTKDCDSFRQEVAQLLIDSKRAA
jgi:pentose-5-phosphate-3-epimerase